MISLLESFFLANRKRIRFLPRSQKPIQDHQKTKKPHGIREAFFLSEPWTRTNRHSLRK
jgi:hypothetical protein